MNATLGRLLCAARVSYKHVWQALNPRYKSPVYMGSVCVRMRRCNSTTGLGSASLASYASFSRCFSSVANNKRTDSNINGTL